MKNLEIIDKVKDSIYPIATFLFILILWQSMVGVLEVPQYILPTPVDIINVFFKDYQNLSMHAVAIIISLVIGILMDFVSIIKKCLYPIMLVTQMIPTIIIAPLFMIWFGFGTMPKVLMVMLTCFFPILISFVDGIENIDKDYLNLFKTMDSNKVNTFIHLKFPMAMDKFFLDLKYLQRML